MTAESMVRQKGDKWIFTEPGYTRFDGNTGKVYEVVDAQEFEYDTHSEAIGHAHYSLNPPREWFPPPPA